MRLHVFLLVCVASAIARKIHIDDNSHGLDIAQEGYMIGVGKYDLTGPAAEINMMGYAMPGQRTAGIHLRLWSRAYIFQDPITGNRVVFVNNDLCMVMQSVKMSVIPKLQAIYGDMYTHDNVLLTGIHTHSGPGGYSWYALYDVTSLGFDKQNFDAVVDGIVSAIQIAHNNVRSAQLQINVGQLLDSNINRSPSGYLNNPEEERALYSEGDTDKNMTVVKITATSDGSDVGAIAWFAVHCTSMNNTNELISSDNKGFASYLFEGLYNKNASVPFREIPFVAAFAQSNEGDVSPNTDGAKCPDGTPCANDSSTCGGKNEQCIAHGPGKDMFESTSIIGTNQFKMAATLYESATVTISGSVQYRHMFVDMTNFTVSGNFTSNGLPGKTCRPAMGYSFAAGTTDGPGAFDFIQADNKTSGNPFWNFISHFVATPSAEQIECQAPKPILLDVGGVEPIPWTPTIVPVQILSIGQLVILAVPGEFTTMSGRRLRNTVREVLEREGFSDPIVVISGLSNTYTGYIATFEEYQVQRYEAASTIYGPHTLGCYQQVFAQLAESLVKNTTLPAGPTPQNLTTHQETFITPVVLDAAPFGKHFGDVVTDATGSYQIGEVVEIVFYGANPRNNLMTESTFLSVEMQDANTQTWVTVLDDANWDTKFAWKRQGLAESLITVTWTIGPNTQSGSYRIQHFGYAKESPLSDKLTPYTGTSSTFTVSA